ncbi:MAG: hypothetical protein NVS1B3_06480 [Candidatus Dormibacteraceae bacterium]
MALRWTVLTAIAYALAASASVSLLGRLGRQLGPIADGMISILAFGCVFGAVVAVPPLLGVPRGVRRRDWLLGTTVGATAGFALAALVGERLGNAVSPTGNIVIGGAAIQILSGATLGLTMGAAQARAFDRSLRLDRRWLVATMVATGLGYAAATGALELLEIGILRANLIPSFGVIVGLFVGIAQSLVLRSRPLRD